MKNDQLLRDLGKAYAVQANDYLREKFASQMELGELGTFSSSASSWIAARAFATIFENAGPEEAEKFLQQLLSNLGANIRLQRIPAMVKTTASVIPTKTKASQPEPEPEPEPASEPEAPKQPEPPPAPKDPQQCVCKMEKGECKACLEKVSQSYRNLAADLLVYMKEMARKTEGMVKDCPRCATRYSDQALASIARDGIPQFANEPPELLEQVFQALVQFAGAIGVTEIPETQRVMNGGK